MVNAGAYNKDDLSADLASSFKSKLKKRISHIEETVDVHLNIIGGLRRNLARPYIYKFGVLTANEHLIRQKDSSSQRMVDVM